MRNYALLRATHHDKFAVLWGALNALQSLSRHGQMVVQDNRLDASVSRMPRIRPRSLL
jgi:hypothetical protein